MVDSFGSSPTKETGVYDHVQGEARGMMYSWGNAASWMAEEVQ